MIKKFFKSFFLISLVSLSSGVVVACAGPQDPPISVGQIENDINNQIDS